MVDGAARGRPPRGGAPRGRCRPPPPPPRRRPRRARSAGAARAPRSRRRNASVPPAARADTGSDRGRPAAARALWPRASCSADVRRAGGGRPSDDACRYACSDSASAASASSCDVSAASSLTDPRRRPWRPCRRRAGRAPLERGDVARRVARRRVGGERRGSEREAEEFALLAWRRPTWRGSLATRPRSPERRPRARASSADKSPRGPASRQDPARR